MSTPDITPETPTDGQDGVSIISQAAAEVVKVCIADAPYMPTEKGIRETLRHFIAPLAAQLAQAQASVAELIPRACRAEELLEKANRQLHLQGQELTDTQQQLAQAQAQLKQLQANFDCLQGAENRGFKAHEETKAELATVRAECERLRGEAVAVTDVARDLAKERNELRTEANRLRAENAELVKVIDLYADTLNEAEAILGGEYADTVSKPLFDMAEKARVARTAALAKHQP